jgi:hypothetical protein
MDVLAAPTDTASLDLSVFAQYGALGIIAATLLWFARGAYQRERDRSDRIEEENRRLNGLILERVIPALTSATRAIEECTELLNALQQERREAWWHYRSAAGPTPADPGADPPENKSGWRRKGDRA